MQVSYTPFFHAKDGEFCALQHATAAHLDRVLPLFEIGRFTEKMGELARYKNSSAPKIAYLDWVSDWVKAVLDDRTVMIDTIAWKHNERTESGEVPAVYAVNGLRERGLAVVPVVGVDRWEDADYQFALKSLSLDDHPIWALRLQSDEIEDAADPEHFLSSIKDIIVSLGLREDQVAILLDFGDVARMGASHIVEASSRVLDLLGGLGFRLFSVVGCSMPPMITEAVKKPNSEAVLKRQELAAWRTLRGKYRTLPITLGDYGVRGPSSSDVQNKHINGKIRYTIEDGYYIARGQSRMHDDGQQMYRLALTVASSAYFLGPEFSWGDDQLYRRAVRADKVRPGSPNCWIKFDTSHHLAWVGREIAAIEHALAAIPVEV